MKRTRHSYWDVMIFGIRERVRARTVGCAVRVAYRRIAARHRAKQVPDKHGRIQQFPPLISNRDGGWDDVQFDRVRNFSEPRFVA